MGKGAHAQVRTVRVRWKQVVALVPAVTMAAAGIALAATADDPGRQALPSVPQQPVQQPEGVGAGVLPVGQGPQAAEPDLAPGLALPEGVAPGSAQLVQLDRLGIPAPALAAYKVAERLLGQADPACHVDWALVAAIGRVESDHGRHAGNQFDAVGVVHPGIFGVRLDGSHGTARIADTDRGRLDGDTAFDRAVGPMQFIPATWKVVGADADGDGQRNPQSIRDAATSTGVYLCAGPGDLRQASSAYDAVRRYNNSDSYVRTVLAIADAYRHGVAALPASSLPAAHGATTTKPDDGGRVEAAASRTRTSSGHASTAGGGSTAGNGGGDHAAPGDGQGGAAAPTPSTAQRPVSAAVGSAGAAVSTVVSVVTDVVRTVLPLPTPTVSQSCVVNLLGIKVCTPVLVSSTTTTVTRTTTTTSTHR